MTTFTTLPPIPSSHFDMFNTDILILLFVWSLTYGVLFLVRESVIVWNKDMRRICNVKSVWRTGLHRYYVPTSDVREQVILRNGSQLFCSLCGTVPKNLLWKNSCSLLLQAHGKNSTKKGSLEKNSCSSIQSCHLHAQITWAKPNIEVNLLSFYLFSIH